MCLYYRMVHSFSNQAYQRPKVRCCLTNSTTSCFKKLFASTLQGIDPEKDPNKLDITDPRHPLNVRRREGARKAGGGVGGSHSTGRKHE